MENHAGFGGDLPLHAFEPVFDPNGWLTLATGAQEEQPARQIHECLVCPRTFLSSQASGGHQQAHRRERERRELATMFQPGPMFHQPSHMFQPGPMFPPSHMFHQPGHMFHQQGPMFHQPMFHPSHMFQPSHFPIMPMFGPLVRVEPPPLTLELGLDPVAPNIGYPGLLERRLFAREVEDQNILGRMEVVESEGEEGEEEDDNITEVTLTCTELKHVHGHGSGDHGYGSEEGGGEVSSKGLDLTLRL